jgi:hypothetical protein
MNTITFDVEKAKIIEDAVCLEFGCSISEIVGFKNTFFKKVVVFLLVKVHGYNKRNIGLKYQITYLYVPTVVEELEWQFRNVLVFKNAINNVCKNLGYECDLDFGGKHNFN